MSARTPPLVQELARLSTPACVDLFSPCCRNLTLPQLAFLFSSTCRANLESIWAASSESIFSCATTSDNKAQAGAIHREATEHAEGILRVLLARAVPGNWHSFLLDHFADALDELEQAADVVHDCFATIGEVLQLA